MKIILISSKIKLSKILFIFSIIFKLSFSEENELFSKGSGIINSKYNHNSTDNLYFIFEHFRHGARATCEGEFINNTDILGGKWMDSGELTKKGKMQHFSIGAKNKLRYKNFINTQYDPKEIKIFSTDYNRTINSAQFQLLGIYNKISFNNISNNDIIGEEKIEVNLNNIIPPINFFEYIKEDNDGNYEFLYREKFTCPLFKENINKNKRKIYTFEDLNIIRKNFNEKYYDIILAEFNLSSTKSHPGMYNFCDAFIANYYDDNNRLILVELEKKNKTFNLTDILDICYNYYKNYFFKIEGEKSAKINGILSMSKTFKKIEKIMENRIKNGNQKYINYDSPKFLLYSGHDDTLTQMQMFLNICFEIEYEWVPYASTQLFELRKYGDKFYVEIYYNDRLKLNITFNEFSKKIENYRMTEKEIYGKCYSLRITNFYRLFFLQISLIILLIIYISLRIYYYYKNFKKASNRPILIK